MDIYSVASGNIGAFTFMMDALKKDPVKAQEALKELATKDIVGDKLYMLWNDCCNRDTDMTVKIALEHTIEDIEKHINYEHGRGIPYGQE